MLFEASNENGTSVKVGWNKKRGIKNKECFESTHRTLPALISANFVILHCSILGRSAAGDPPCHGGLTRD